MDDGIHPAAGLQHGGAITEVGLHRLCAAPEEDLHARVVAIEVAAEQVDGMAVVQELGGGVRAEEAGGAGDEESSCRNINPDDVANILAVDLKAELFGHPQAGGVIGRCLPKRLAAAGTDVATEGSGTGGAQAPALEFGDGHHADILITPAQVERAGDGGKLAVYKCAPAVAALRQSLRTAPGLANPGGAGSRPASAAVSAAARRRTPGPRAGSATSLASGANMTRGHTCRSGNAACSSGAKGAGALTKPFMWGWISAGASAPGSPSRE